MSDGMLFGCGVSLLLLDVLDCNRDGVRVLHRLQVHQGNVAQGVEA